ncbi:MAG TPA: tetratricopeptide repeat protein [Terriglobia bacterium]|nr:tetratricopeptide repeat protein [Terriglobia bacterium]
MTAAVLRSILFMLIGAVPLVAGDIEGRIRAGSDMRRAVIQLLRERIVVEEHFIGPDARFEFHDLNRGSYIVRVRADGYLEQEIAVDLIRRNSREMLSIDLRPAEVRPDGPADTISVIEFQIPHAAKRDYEEGLEHRKRGQCNKALPRLQSAIAAFDKYGEAFNELGNCYIQLKELGKAEEAFKKAIEYTSTIYPSMNLADLYVSQKRFVEARNVIRQCMLKHPAEGDLYFAMALIHFSQGQLTQTEEAGLQAHQKIHRMADVHLMLAKVYLALKNYPALVGQLRLYLDENPKGSVADRIRKNLRELERRR